jgi:hypothetical protein
MWWPAVGIFRLSQLERELEARHLALGRAAIALGRKVLADNPPPNIWTLAQHETKRLPFQQPHGDRMRIAVEQKARAKRERQSLERQHLSMAEGHVTKAERVIRDQVAIIESLRCDGHDTALAEETLRIFEANLQVMREHRELIIRAIEEPL